MKIIVSFLLLSSISSTSWACSSSNHRHLKIKPLSNDVETYPKLFTFIDNSDHKQIKSVCPKPRPSRTCQMIRINFDAFKSRKMKFDFDQSNSATLKKTTEEGLDLVLVREVKGATATLTYKVKYSLYLFPTVHFSLWVIINSSLWEIHTCYKNDLIGQNFVYGWF